MTIELHDLGKKYSGRWLYRNVSRTFEDGGHYAITGPNASGKSTLLKLMAGQVEPNEGEVSWRRDGEAFEAARLYTELAISAPYLQLYDQMTLLETIRFHRQHKPMKEDKSEDQFIREIDLEDASNRPLSEFSSGMMQRVKLGLAWMTDSQVLLLDEPLSNLDKTGVSWYLELAEKYKEKRLIIVFSNAQEREYSFCDEVISLENL